MKSAMHSRLAHTLMLAVAFSIGLTLATNVSSVHAQSGNKVQEKQKVQKKQKPKLGILNQKAPELTVNVWQQLPKSNTTNEIKLEDYRGKVVYLYFFQSWCPGCHSQGFPTLAQLQKKFADDKEVVFLTIQTTFEGKSTNTPQRGLATAKKFKLQIPVGHSEAKRGSPQIMRDYRTGGTPWTVVVDKKGIVRFNDFHIKPADGTKLIETLKKK